MMHHQFIDAGDLFGDGPQCCSILESPLRLSFGTDKSDVEMLSSPCARDRLRRYSDDSSLGQSSSGGSDYTASKLYTSVSSGSFEGSFELTDSASNRLPKKAKIDWDADLSAQFSPNSTEGHFESISDSNRASILRNTQAIKKYRTRRSADVEASVHSLPVQPFAPPAAVLSHPSVNSMGVALGMPCFGPVAIPQATTCWATPMMTMAPPPLPALSTAVINPAACGVLPDLRKILASKTTSMPIGLKLDCAAVAQELKNTH